MDYSYYMLDELQRLETLSDEYNEELKFLSKRIRMDFWNEHNTKELARILGFINSSYMIFLQASDYFDLDCIINYVLLLAKYCLPVCPYLNANYYNQLIDDIQMENARVIIEKQWQDITVSKDGLKSFTEIFDEIFTKCLNDYKNQFFHELKDTDILCRVVNDKYPINKERFIPWDNTDILNRWNPPGKTYLYLSFSENDTKYSSELKLSEYICLEEYRASKGNKYYFCNFFIVNKGVIFDLSYNDISLRSIKNYLDDYQNNLTSKIIQELIADPKALTKCSSKRKLNKAIKQKQLKYNVDKSIIGENIAKQYLKMICNCIYKKVDETDDAKRELAYKSFWILAQYLEGKGVTGIIYPCTRTNKVHGKNLVLFNKYDAEPIESTIREFDY